MKNKTLSKIILALSLLTFFTSCVTPKIKSHPVEPFGVIGANADLYVYLPVKNNKVFIDGLLGEMAEDKYTKMAINRTKLINFGVFQNRSDSEVRLCAVGNYPSGLTDAMFQDDKGWTKKVTQEKHKYYESYDLDVSIPNSKFAFLIITKKERLENMEQLLSKITNPDKPVFSSEFETFITAPEPDGVGLFSSNPNYIIGKLLGVDLGLPVKTIEMYFFNEEGTDTYSYSLIAETKNPGTTFALSMLLGKMMNGNIVTEDYFVRIDNATISYDELKALLKDVY